MKRNVAFIHTSPAAIGPLMQFYSEAAPELQITNLLDDGLLRLLAAKDTPRAECRLAEMVGAAREVYAAEVAMITCSSVSREMAGRLSGAAGMPILKIDYPMARQAAEAGGRIGVAVTFPPTLETTSALLREAAAEAGADIEIRPEIMPEAYDALLAGDHRKHDDLLLAGVRRLDERGVKVIVLAQVSMARILPLLGDGISAPVLSSLTTSLRAVREALNTTA